MFPAFALALLTSLLALTSVSGPARPSERRTELAIRGDEFLIDGRPTYEGRTWKGRRIQGLLLNSRMVQGIFDDLNTATVARWAYPDTGYWSPDRNAREFVDAMPEWRRHGLLAFTINLQGGSPQGYSKEQPWHNSAIAEDGSLRLEYMQRLELILDRADELGMVVILGVFYFGQDQRLKDEESVVRAIDHTIYWVLDRGYRNVMIEVNNECDVRYDHPVLQPGPDSMTVISTTGPRFIVSMNVVRRAEAWNCPSPSPSSAGSRAKARRGSAVSVLGSRIETHNVPEPIQAAIERCDRD